MVALPSDRHTNLTVEQYLALEADAPLKHESRRRADRRVRRAAQPRADYRQRGCGIARATGATSGIRSAFASDMRVRVSETIYFYPDVVVAFDRAVRRIRANSPSSIRR